MMTRRWLSLLLATILFLGPSAPAWAQVNVPSETILVEATVLASAVHAATVATGAFVFIDGVDLSSHIGRKITLRDSTGRTIVGYVSRAGTGEALDPTNMIPAGFDFTTANWAKFFATAGDADTFTTTAANGKVYTSADILTIGALYKGTLNGNVDVGTAYLSDGGAVAVVVNFASGTGALGVVGYGTVIADRRIAFRASNSGATVDITAATTTLQRVTEPPVTGIVISAGKGSGLQSWSATTTGFDANAVTFYSIAKTHVAPVVHSGAIGAGLGHLSLVDGTAFADPDIGEDWGANFADGRHMLVVYDPTGKSAGAFIKVAGGGEELDGTNLLAGIDFTDAGTWTPMNGSAGDADTYTTTATGGMIKASGFTVDALYKSQVSGDVSESTFNLYDSGGTVVMAAGFAAAKYATPSSAGIYFKNNIAATTNITVDATTYSNRVTIPSTTGVTLTNTQGGGVYNWLWKTVGFDPNGGLSFKIYYLGA